MQKEYPTDRNSIRRHSVATKYVASPFWHNYDTSVANRWLGKRNATLGGVGSVEKAPAGTFLKFRYVVSRCQDPRGGKRLLVR